MTIQKTHTPKHTHTTKNTRTSPRVLREHIYTLATLCVLPFMVVGFFVMGFFLASTIVQPLELKSDATGLGALLNLGTGGALNGITGTGSVGGVSYDASGGGVNIGFGADAGGQRPGCGSDNCLKPVATNQFSLGVATQTSLRAAILHWVNFFLGFLALIATALLIYSGFRYLGAGVSGTADAAKKGIIYAVIGILIIFCAYAIVATLIGSVPTGSDIQTSANILQTPSAPLH